MRSLFFILSLFLFLHGYPVNNPFITRYTVEDGLATNYFMDVFQDSKGFLWFSSNSGVTRFDGNNFKTFDMGDGLDDNSVMNVKEDIEGRIWFMNYNGTLNFYKDNTIYNSANTPFLKDLKTNFFIVDFFQDSDSTMYFYNFLSEVFVVKNNKLNDYRDFEFNNRNDLGLFCINKSADGKFQMWAASGLYTWENINDTLDFHPVKVKLEKIFINGRNKTIAVDWGENIHFFEGSEIKEENVFHIETQYIRSIFVDSEGYLWVLTRDKGVFCIKDGKLELHLDIYESCSVCEDGQGKIWVTSKRSGLYKIDKGILKYNYLTNEAFEGLPVTTLESSNDGGVWAANREKIFYLKEGKTYPLDVKTKETGTENIYHLKNNTLISASSNSQMIVVYNAHFDPVTETVGFDDYKFSYYLVKGFLVGEKEEKIYSSINDKIIEIDVINGFNISLIKLRVGWIYNIYLNSDNNIIINSDINYITSDIKKFWKFKNHLTPFNGKIISSHLAIDNKADLYIIFGNEIYLHIGEDTYKLSEDFDLEIDYQIKDMAYDGSTLYFFTIKTIYYIKNPLKIVEGEPVKLNILNNEFNNINDILYYDSTLYIADDDGLTMIPIKEINENKTVSPRPYFSKLCLNHEEIALSNGQLSFKGKKKLNIEFGSLNFSSIPVVYHYKLEGYDNGWQQTSSSEITYRNLPPGEYTFMLQSNLINNVKGISESFKIHRLPTIYEMKAAWVIGCLLSLFLLILIILVLKNRQLRKKEIESQLNSLENKALQSMMNPHFIFNSLGSIQSYLMENKPTEAGMYLSQFARLIRQNMNSLRSNFISIQDEVDRLRNYLDLEKLRTNSKFDYSIQPGKTIDTEETFIPSMLVQPFVENAIWHGVSGLNGDGFIIVNFLILDKSRIIVSIKDNGKGIGKSNKASPTNNHLSMGITLSQKRLKLIGEVFKVKSSISIHEAKPGQPRPGTHVEITMPFTNNIDSI